MPQSNWNNSQLIWALSQALWHVTQSFDGDKLGNYKEELDNITTRLYAISSELSTITHETK